MNALAQEPPSALSARNQAAVRLWLPRLGLSHCVRAIVARSTLGVGHRWPHEQHFNHFPASPLCSIGWLVAGHTEFTADGWPPEPGVPGTRLPQIYFSGPFTRPTVSRNSPEGHGLILMLLPDALQAMTGLNPSEWVNRVEPLSHALGTAWQAMGDAVLATQDDDARVALIQDFLLPRWQAARPAHAAPGLRSLHDWSLGLAMRAASSGFGRSLRQAERRIKGWTGLPMRELRGLSRAEQAFFRALAEGEQPVNWADVAADTGYADQSHLCRETRRVTGFAPAELRRRIAEEEAFWIYRIWT